MRALCSHITSRDQVMVSEGPRSHCITEIKMCVVCNICGVTAEDAKGGRLVRDHDHTSGHIRGMLCDTCNSWLHFYECLKNGVQSKRKVKTKHIEWMNRYKDQIEKHLLCNTEKLYRTRPKFGFVDMPGQRRT